MEQKEELLEKAKQWFRVIGDNHIKNTQKLIKASEFKINPFTVQYLANFLTGNSDPKSIAKALIYPRVLGTSLTTIFGNQIQFFTAEVLDSFGSTTSGIDIEFTDKVDGLKKYCQLKSGPNTINKDDVESIAGHFTGVINLAKTNNTQLGFNNLVVGIFYGEKSELSGHYKRITNQYHYPVYIGQEFWHRLTGDENFYDDLIESLGEVAIEANYKEELEEVINKLALTQEIIDYSDKD